MSTIEKFVSPFIPQQFPTFYKEEGPNFVAFVKAYYEWMESTNQTLQRSRSLLEYADIDTTEQEFLKYFRSTYLHSLPESIIADKRLLVKHILDLYRAKGTPRAYELLFRLIFNEDIELYVPSEFIFKPSDGEWTVPRYIEVSDSDYLEKLIGKQIYNNSRNATAVVESVNQKIVNKRLFHVLTLSSIKGRFKFGEKVLCASVPEITLANAPNVLGSLTAIAIENGGLGFTAGDIVDVTGDGVAGKARIAAVRDENGKVNFQLENGGSGYSLDGTVVTVATALNLIIENPTGTFSNGNVIKSSNTSANGTLVSSNSSFLKLINFSANSIFNPGDTVTNSVAVTLTDVGNLVTRTSHGYTNGTQVRFYDIVTTTGLTVGQAYYVINATINTFQVASTALGSAIDLVGDGSATIITGSAVVSRVTGGGGTGASFTVGGLVNKEVLLINTDRILEKLDLNLSNPWDFAKYDLANLSSTIVETLEIINREVGTISFLSRINPGTGYSASPFVSVVEPIVSSQAMSDGLGGIKGLNAVVSTSVANSQGIATAVEVVNSGFGFQPGEKVFLSSSNNAGVVVTGVSVIDTDGVGDGYWKNNKGFLSDIMNIQDSYYYQDFSYEILVNRMLTVYEKIVKDLIHPSGVALFGRFRLKNQDLGEPSEPKFFGLETSVVAPTEPTNLISLTGYNNITLNRNSSATYFRSADDNLVEVGANVARLDPVRGMLLGGQRTNIITNPRFEGGTIGVIGSGGVYPAGITFTGAGINQEILSFDTWRGAPAMQIRLTSASPPTSFVINFAGTTTLTATEGLVHSAYAWVSGGSLTNVGASSWSNGGGAGAVVTVPSISTTPALLVARRASTGVAQTSGFRVACTGGAAAPIDITITIALPQAENAGLQTFPSSAILPPIGSLVASTRLTDNLSTPTSALNIPTNGLCTMVGTFALSNLGSGSYLPNLMEINAGSLYERAWIYNSASTLVLAHPTNMTLIDEGDLIEYTSHGLTDGMEVRFSYIVNTTGISIDQVYYVINATTNNFQVSSSVGGPAVALTTDGKAIVGRVTTNVTLNGSTITRASHGFLNGTQVKFTNVGGTTGLTINQVYFVINAFANTFQISTTLGGTAVTLTGSNGTANVARVVLIATLTDAGDLITQTLHGFVDGTQVRFANISGTTGLTVGQTYYVISATTNTFQVSVTVGGAAVALTGNGIANVTRVFVNATLTDAGDLITGANHGFINGMEVRFSDIVTTTGIVAGTSYYVLNATTNTFQVSATPGSLTAVVLGTGNGSATVTKVVQTATLTDAGDLITRTSHGFLNGAEVKFIDIVATTGLSVDQVYYVINATTANTFQVSATLGGPAVTLTTDGTATVVSAAASFETSITIGSGIVANTPFRVSMSHDGNGRIAASLNNGTVQSLTRAPTTYTTMRVGSGFGGDQPVFGYQRGFSYLNYAVEDVRLRQLSTLT